VELEGLTLQHPPKAENVKEMLNMKWYWFTFADGYQVCCRGMDRIEKAAEERKHGKLVSKKLA
jgi:hypothetical protein